jgi:type II restriction enzyme
MALRGNKGEWSEVYVLLKSLSDGVLFAGDKNAKIIKQLIYPIIKIIRDNSDGVIEYNTDHNLVFINDNGQKLCSLPISKFADNAKYLLEQIKSNGRTFELPELEEFLNKIQCTSIKAKSTVKSDIRIVIHDLRTGQMPELGFSIKSQIGNPSTLLNAGKTTNFVYKISKSMSESKMHKINSISSTRKIKDRIQSLHDSNCQLIFSRTEKTILGNNLLLIDSLLPNITSELLLLYYSGQGSNVNKLVETLEELNPLGFDQSSCHKFYSYKLKRLLTDIALGMIPSKVWSGKYDATGGCLIVKDNGDILCYHIYDRNEFEDYLLSNTKLETASSSRHDFGIIYKDGNDYYMKLNLQIRFIK